MSTAEDVILSELVCLIENDNIRLPTLPEVAMRARQVAQSPDASAADIAHVIKSDPAMAARVLKVANSPLMRGPREVRDIHTAITRLGLTCICNLITGLAMEQMFRANAEIIDRAMRRSWWHSTDVAGVAYVLCEHFTPHLKPDQAVLAAMLHEIGVLPILTHLEEKKGVEDAGVLQRILERLHPMVGGKILESWRFPEELINVPRCCVAFDRESLTDMADYADLIQVANLHTHRGSNHAYARVDWSTLPAAKRIGVLPEALSTPAMIEEMTATTGGFR